jgi:hypothetical protein
MSGAISIGFEGLVFVYDSPQAMLVHVSYEGTRGVQARIPHPAEQIESLPSAYFLSLSNRYASAAPFWLSVGSI